MKFIRPLGGVYCRSGEFHVEVENGPEGQGSRRFENAGWPSGRVRAMEKSGALLLGIKLIKADRRDLTFPWLIRVVVL